MNTRPLFAAVAAGLGGLLALLTLSCDANRGPLRTCDPGTSGCHCYGNATCNRGLTCVRGTCVEGRWRTDVEDADLADSPSELDTDSGPPPCKGSGGIQRAISASADNTCAILEGNVYCWGVGPWGDPALRVEREGPYATTPQRAKSLTSAVDVAAMDDPACTVCKSGDVLCTGPTGLKQSAPDGKWYRVDVPNIEHVEQVVDLGLETCFLGRDGTVRCWEPDDGGEWPTLEQIPNTVELSAGSSFLCGRLASGSVKCVGDAADGQLGHGVFAGSEDPVRVQGISSAVDIASGDGFTCAVLSSGTVECWGDGDHGQLGSGIASKSATPVEVRGLDSAVAVDASEYYACALLQSGEIRCWRRAEHGEFGVDFEKGVHKTPVKVEGISSATAIATGSAHAEAGHSCALVRDRGAKCWGTGEHGELGNGSAGRMPTPVRIRGIDDAVDVAIGLHACSLTNGGDVRCWGREVRNHAPSAGEDEPATTPVRVKDLGKTVDIAAFWDGNCAVLNSGRVRCWAYSGDDESTHRQPRPASKKPTRIEGLSDVKQISLNFHACAVTNSGAVKCWGRNEFGELGLGGGRGHMSRDNPTRIDDLPPTHHVANGDKYTCALLRNGLIRCWGNGDSGALGDGHTEDRHERSAPGPPVPGLTSVIDIATSSSNGIDDVGPTCAVDSSGHAYCWGHGYLGDGYAERSAAEPVRVDGIDSAVGIVTGEEHACVRLEEGSVRCWGEGKHGQLGNGALHAQSQPVRVKDISTATKLTAGPSSTCAVLESGRVHCWGSAGSGVLGSKGHYRTTTPVRVEFPE